MFELVNLGQLTQEAAAVRLGISSWWVRTKLKRYRQHGDNGIIHGNRGHSSPNKWDYGQVTFAMDLLRNDWVG